MEAHYKEKKKQGKKKIFCLFFLLVKFNVQRKSLLRIGYPLTFEVGVSHKFFLKKKKKYASF